MPLDNSLLDRLCKNDKTLETLDLRKQIYSDEDALALRKALKINTTLLHLNISENPGCRLDIIFAGLLNPNLHLESINFSSTKGTNEQYISGLIRLNTVLKFYNISIIDVSVNDKLTGEKEWEGVMFFRHLAEFLDRNKMLQKTYVKPLAKAAEEGNIAAIIKLLIQMKKAFPGIGVKAEKLSNNIYPVQLIDLYNYYANPLILSEEMYGPEAISVLIESPYIQTHAAIILHYLLAHPFQEPAGETNCARYRVVLWLLFQQPKLDKILVRSCIEAISGSKTSTGSTELTQDAQFLSYAQLLAAAQELKKSYEGLSGFECNYRMQLIAYCSRYQSYNPNIALSLLCFSEVRDKLGLKPDDKPLVIDFVIISSANKKVMEENPLLSKLLQSEDFKNKDKEQQAESILTTLCQINHGLSIVLRFFSALSSSNDDVVQIIDSDREILASKLKSIATPSLLLPLIESWANFTQKNLISVANSNNDQTINNEDHSWSQLSSTNAAAAAACIELREVSSSSSSASKPSNSR